MANPPLASNVKLLCHFDGTNGQTTTIDSSLNGRSLTMVGSLSTTQSKFGGTALETVTNGNNHAEAVDSPDWTFGSGAFTVEAWVYYTSAPTTTSFSIVSQWGNGLSGNLGWCFGHNASNFAFFYSTTGSNNPSVSAAWTPTLNTWYHVAADRDASNVLRIYVDGVVKASATVALAFFDSPSVLDIGGITAFSAVRGYIDEVRIVKGEAVYGGAFTPPTAPFPDPASTTTARLSQMAVEVLRFPTSVNAQLSQMAIEVLRPNVALGSAGDPVQRYTVNG